MKTSRKPGEGAEPESAIEDAEIVAALAVPEAGTDTLPGAAMIELSADGTGLPDPRPLDVPPVASEPAPERTAPPPQGRADEAPRAEKAARSAPTPLIPAAAPARRSGGFVPALFGGILAAGAGYGVAQVVPQGWPVGLPAGLADTVAAQADEIARLSQTVAGIPAPVAPDFAPLEARLGEVAARMDAVEAVATAAGAKATVAETKATAAETRSADTAAALAALPPPVEVPALPAGALAAMENRLATLEALPPGTTVEGDPVAIAALQADLGVLKAAVAASAGQGGGDAEALAALRAEVEALRAEIAAPSGPVQAAVAEVTAASEAAQAALAEATAEAAVLKADAEAAALQGRQQAALGSIRAALESGAPFVTAVEALQAGGITLDPVLTAAASQGMPTLAGVQEVFPAAARRALEDSLRADMGDSALERVGSYLRTQVGARSLSPREGTDPDAVLSRAEAALADGRLADALAELAGLPEAGRAALADWQALAQRRIDAEAAVGALAATLAEG